VARELGLKMEEIEISTRGNMEFRKINPLGKIPALVLDDGSALFDSPVICEYLDSQHRGRKFLPRKGRERWVALRLQAMADGLLDAAS